MTILKEAVDAILDERTGHKEANDYFEGNVPETFSTLKLRRAFRITQDHSRLNFCRPVVNAVNDRLEIASISGDTKAATDKITQVWENNGLELEANEIHRSALIHGECYVIVWPDSNGQTQITLNSPMNVEIVYDPENPRVKQYAVKMWCAGEKDQRLNIYTDTAINKYQADTTEVTAAGTDWTFLETVDNPWGEVPVFHFRTERPNGRPEHKDAYDAQNAINKLFITNMFTIDYQGAPQRYALSRSGGESNEQEDFTDGDTERENVNSLKNGPGEIWYMKGISTMGEFKPADPAIFWQPIKDTVAAISALTSTPLRYFETASGKVPTGGESRTLDAALLKKVKDRCLSFGASWKELMVFVLKIEGIKSKVSVYWKAVESLDELERWDLTLKKINAGLSHRQALRENGYTDPEIEKIMAEAKLEADAGLLYQRAPVTRVNTAHDLTQPVQKIDPMTGKIPVPDMMTQGN